MAKVIKFPQKKAEPQSDISELKILSDKIDEIIVTALMENKATLAELTGLLSHRLGTLIKNFEERDKLWAVCEQVLKQQAKIGKKSL